jgi:hypothetical protein
MARGKVKIVAKPVGAQGVLRKFVSATAGLHSDLQAAERELGRKAELAFAAYAPVKTGRLIRGISSFALGNGVTVKAEALNPESGYDYVGVTRFGHGVIRPKYRVQKKNAGIWLQERAPHLFIGKAGALRFTVGGKVVFAAYVNAWKPAMDWAEAALPEVETQAQAVASRLGAKIEARF